MGAVVNKKITSKQRDFLNRLIDTAQSLINAATEIENGLMTAEKVHIEKTVEYKEINKKNKCNVMSHLQPTPANLIEKISIKMDIIIRSIDPKK